MATPDPIQDLFAERSFPALVRAGPSVFREKRDRKIILAGAVFWTMASTYLFWLRPAPWVTSTVLLDDYLKWAEIGLSVSATILGFWLTGFSILFAVIQPQTAKRLAEIEGRDGRTSSELKYIFLSFASVFVHFLLYAIWCTAYIGLWSDAGFMREIGTALCSPYSCLCRLANQLYGLVFAIWTTTLLVRLKSFGYNLYQTLLLGLADHLGDIDAQS